MKPKNDRKTLEKRNNQYFNDYLGMNLSDYFNKMASIGKPKGFGDGKWSVSNPTAGRCGSVVNSLRISGKIPDGFIACGQKEKSGGSHFYLINPDSNEVIDPTVYQMEDDYCYENYHTKFLPQLSKNVKDTMEVLGLVIDKNKFIKTTTSKGVTIIKKRK
jgi:hypothetical protein